METGINPVRLVPVLPTVNQTHVQKLRELQSQ